MLSLFPFFISILTFQPSPPRVSFCAVGDIMLDRGIRKKIELYGIDYPFAAVRPFINRYDVAFCNLECPISTLGASTGKLYCFRGDTSFFSGVRNAGFTVFSLANNHIIDWGRLACMDTKKLIEGHSLIAVGAGDNQAEACRAAVIHQNGLNIAVIAAIGPPLQGLVWRKDKPGPAQPTLDELLSEVSRIRDTVDFVVVSLHWGVEYQHLPQQEQVKWAHLLIDKGADLILGHHPHILQGIEWYKDRIIVYSLGNFVFDQRKLYQRQSGIFTCVFRKGAIDSAAFYPVILENMQPIMATGQTSVAILENLKNFSGDFNTRFLETTNRLLITDSVYATSIATPLLFSHVGSWNIAVDRHSIILRDSTGLMIADTLVQGSDLEIKECCAHSNSVGVYVWSLVGHPGQLRGEYILQYFISDTSRGEQWRSTPGDQPWKIMLANIDGDTLPEVCIGTYTRTPFSPMYVNRLSMYRWEGSHLKPLWQGSRLEQPFDDFTFADLNKDGLDEFITYEETSGKGRLRLYQWLGFGFCEYKNIDYVLEENTLHRIDPAIFVAQ